MAVFKTSDGCWRYSFDAPWSTPEKRARLTKSGFSTKKEAIEAEAQRRASAQEEDPKRLGVSRGVKTLRDLLEEFLVDSEARISPKTLLRYRENREYLSPEVLEMKLTDLTPLILHREWRRLLDGGGRGRRAGRPLRAKTVRNISGMVSSAMSKAIFWGLLPANPVENSEPPKIVKKKVDTFTGAQLELLIKAASPEIAMMLELCDGTGARRGEILALTWGDIQEGRVSVTKSLCQVKQEVFIKPTKTERWKSVTLPERTIRLLESHRKAQNEIRAYVGDGYRRDLDLIVCGPDGGYLKPDSVSAAVSALCKKLKFPPGLSLHKVRHTHASELLAHGMELPAVSARLGHASVSTTMNMYSHAIRGRDDIAAGLWDKLRDGKGKEEVKQ
jgi:integrase